MKFETRAPKKCQGRSDSIIGVLLARSSLSLASGMVDSIRRGSEAHRFALRSRFERLSTGTTSKRVSVEYFCVA